MADFFKIRFSDSMRAALRHVPVNEIPSKLDLRALLQSSILSLKSSAYDSIRDALVSPHRKGIGIYELDSTDRKSLHQISENLVESDFSAEEKRWIQEIIGEILRGEAPIGLIGDAWYQLQMSHLKETTPNVVRLDTYPLHQLVAPLNGTKAGQADPFFVSTISDYLSKKPYPELATSVREIEVDLRGIDEQWGLIFKNLATILRRIEGVLGEKVKLAHTTTDSIHFRIFSPRFYKMALRLANPSRNFEIRYGAGEFDPTSYREMQLKNEYGRGLPWKNILLEDFGFQVPGWVFGAHDDYHIADKAMLHEETHAALNFMWKVLHQLPEKYKNTRMWQALESAVIDREGLIPFSTQDALEKLWSPVMLHFAYTNFVGHLPKKEFDTNTQLNPAVIANVIGQEPIDHRRFLIESLRNPWGRDFLISYGQFIECVQQTADEFSREQIHLEVLIHLRRIQGDIKDALRGPFRRAKEIKSRPLNRTPHRMG